MAAAQCKTIDGSHTRERRSSIALNTLFGLEGPLGDVLFGQREILAESVMSAPTMNTSLPLVTSRPLTLPSFCSAAAASPSSCTVRASNLLIGSPERSKQSSAMPLGCWVTRNGLPLIHG